MHQNALMGSSGSRECAIGRLTSRGEVVKGERGKGGEERVLGLSRIFETLNNILETSSGLSGGRECTIGWLTLLVSVVESPGEEDGEKTVPVLSLMLETSNDVLGTHRSVHLVEMKAT
jgi:hypothetical protein